MSYQCLASVQPNWMEACNRPGKDRPMWFARLLEQYKDKDDVLLGREFAQDYAEARWLVKTAA